MILVEPPSFTSFKVKNVSGEVTDTLFPYLSDIFKSKTMLKSSVKINSPCAPFP